MHKFLSILLFCFVAVLFAQDHAEYKNALGWESGLSYRRYINNTVWVGINLTGSYTNNVTNDTSFDQDKKISNDSITYQYINADKDTTKTYSGTVKIELGKEIFKYKKLDISIYLGAGYTLTDSRTYQFNSGSYLNETKGHSILGIIGLEPKIFLWDKISIGTQLGIQYTYSTSNYTYDNQNYEGNTAYTDVGMENRTTNINNFQLFGNISLSSVLVVHYYF